MKRDNRKGDDYKGVIKISNPKYLDFLGTSDFLFN